MAKFTPGPWRLRELVNNTLAVYGAGECDVVFPKRNAPRDANAHLIAAAPALYEALEAIAPWLRNGDYDTRGGLIEMDRLASVAEAALATARQQEE